MFKKENIIKIQILFMSLIAVSCVGKPPTTIGNYTDCPDKPNCVSTKNSYSTTYIEPIRYDGSRAEAKKLLLLTLESFEIFERFYEIGSSAGISEFKEYVRINNLGGK